MAAQITKQLKLDIDKFYQHIQETSSSHSFEEVEGIMNLFIFYVDSKTKVENYNGFTKGILNSQFYSFVKKICINHEFEKAFIKQTLKDFFHYLKSQNVEIGQTLKNLT